MSASELLRLIVQADTQGAVRGLEQIGSAADRNLVGTQSKTDRLAGSLQKFGAVAVSAGAVAAAGLYKAGQAASNLGEVVSKTQVVFDDSADAVEDFADSAAKIGQSKRAALEAASGFGNLFTSMGLAADRSADMSIELTKLASDLASFSNTSPEDAILALSSALIGEAEPIRRYGVLLDEATLKQKALDMGLVSSTTGTLPPAIKAQAAYAAILEQTKNAQGDFERTSGSLANQQRILKAEFENAAAAVGQGALPVLTKLTGIAADAASGFVKLDEATGGAAGTVATFATGALLVGGGLSIVIGKVLEMRKVFLNADKVTGDLTGGLNKLGKAGVLVGIGVGLHAMGQMIKASTEMKVNLDDLAVGLAKTDQATQRQLQSAVLGAQGIGKLDDMVRGLADTNVVAAERLVATAEAAGIEGDALDKLRGIVDGKKAAEAQASADAKTHAESMGAAGDAAGAYGGKVETAAEKVERLKDELTKATEAIEDNYSAMFEGTSLAIDYEAAIDDLIEGFKENGRTLDISTEKGRANVEQMLRTGESIAALIQKRYAETGSINDASTAGAFYVENLRAQLRAAGFTEQAIAGLIAQMHLTPEQISTEILADVSEASRAVNDYQAQLNMLPGVVETLFNGRVVSRPNRMDENAHGTSFFRGGLTWVGERGPEIVELPRGSAIYDNATSQRMAASAAPVGRGGVQTVVVQIGLHEVARFLVDADTGATRRGFAA